VFKILHIIVLIRYLKSNIKNFIVFIISKKTYILLAEHSATGFAIPSVVCLSSRTYT